MHVEHFDTVTGDALALWHEGNASYRTPERGYDEHLRFLPPLAEAYVAYVGDKAAAVVVVFPHVQSQRCDQLLSYTRPEFRGVGAWAAADDAAQNHLHQRGYRFFMSTVIEGVPGMREAVEKRGAVVVSTNMRRPIEPRGAR